MVSASITLSPLLIGEIIFFAVFVGVISAALGIGGGFVVTPVLILIFGFEPTLATGTALFMISFTALSATQAYYKKNLIRYKIGLFLALATILGSSIGAYISVSLESSVYRILFSVLMLPIALRFIVKPKRPRRSLEESNEVLATEKQSSLEEAVRVEEVGYHDLGIKELVQHPRALAGLMAAFFTGVIASLLGIGGGVLMVPILALVFDFEQHEAVATSAFIMIFTALSGVAVKLANDQVDVIVGAILAIGIVVGAQIGARVASRLPAVTLQRIFGSVMVIALVSIALK